MSAEDKIEVRLDGEYNSMEVDFVDEKVSRPGRLHRINLETYF